MDKLKSTEAYHEFITTMKIFIIPNKLCTIVSLHARTNLINQTLNKMIIELSDREAFGDEVVAVHFYFRSYTVHK